MNENNDIKEKDNINSDEKIIDFYSKISENILLMDELLDKYDNKEEAIKEYQKTKNKL